MIDAIAPRRAEGDRLRRPVHGADAPARGQRADPSAVERAGDVVLSTTETDGKGGTRDLGGDAALRRIGARRARRTTGRIPAASSGACLQVTSRGSGSSPREVESGQAHPAVRAGRGERLDRLRRPAGGTIPAVSVRRRPARPRSRRDASADKIVVVGASAPSLQDVHADVDLGQRADGRAGDPGRERSPRLAASRCSRRRRLADAAADRRAGAVAPLALPAAVAAARRSPPRVGAGSSTPWPRSSRSGRAGDPAGAYPLIALVLSRRCALGRPGRCSTAVGARSAARRSSPASCPGAVVDEVLARRRRRPAPRRRQREGTVMFSDLRGFTRFAERLRARRA